MLLSLLVLSHISTLVGYINNLIPVENRRKNIVEFLMDSKNLFDLEAAAKNDITGTKAVLAEVFKLLTPGPGCLYKRLDFYIITDIKILENLDSIVNDLIDTTSFFEKGFKIDMIQACVLKISNFLDAYKKVVGAKDLDLKIYFENFIPIGDFAKPLSKALLKLLPEKWEEKWGKDSIYGRLKKAIDEDDKAADDKVKTVDDDDKSGNDENKPAGDDKGKATGSEDLSPIAVDVDKKKSTDDENKPADESKSTDDGNKSAGNGGGGPVSGNLGKYFLIGTCIALPLIIIGVVIFFMLRKK